MNEDNIDHLPKDLRDIADALRAERDVADRHLLDRVIHRISAVQPDRGTRGSLRARVAVSALLALALGLNVTGAFASALKATGLSSSNASGLSVNNVVSAASNTNSTGKKWGSAADVPTPEKPGCGNEQNNGVSGNSGDHGGQPPKSEERGNCPRNPGVDGDDNP